MKTVFIVEDHDATMSMMLILLNERGYSVHGCKTGLEAIAGMQEALPDIILTDYFLAGADGLELARWVRSQPGGHRPKIVLVTAGGAAKVDSIRDRLLELDMEVVHKPFEPDNLYETLLRLSRDLDREDAKG